MKRTLFYIICTICMLTIFLPACGANSSTDNVTTHKKQDTGDLPIEEWTEDNVLACGRDGRLISYYEKTYDQYLDMCNYYSENGYEIYTSSEKNGNFFTTMTQGAQRVHIYWIACEEELNIITSYKQGALMPPAQPVNGDDQKATTVTPVYSENMSEMGYVIQLADGSFIIYDGGSAANADKLLGILTELSNGSEIIVRAWVLTVSLPDHYGCFTQFATEHADKIKLEYTISAPVCSPLAIAGKQTYLTNDLEQDVAKFAGAVSCYVHTGMTFYFCNVKLEILFTPEEIYICDAPTHKEFHNTSIVSRISTDNKSIMMLSDSGIHVARRLAIYYGENLSSSFCQMSQNGNSDFPQYVYNIITAGDSDKLVRTDSSVIVLD